MRTVKRRLASRPDRVHVAHVGMMLRVHPGARRAEAVVTWTPISAIRRLRRPALLPPSRGSDRGDILSGVVS
jgi:hypothetical protein